MRLRSHRAVRGPILSASTAGSAQAGYSQAQLAQERAGSTVPVPVGSYLKRSAIIICATDATDPSVLRHSYLHFGRLRATARETCSAWWFVLSKFRCSSRPPLSHTYAPNWARACRQRPSTARTAACSGSKGASTRHVCTRKTRRRERRAPGSQCRRRRGRRRGRRTGRRSSPKPHTFAPTPLFVFSNAFSCFPSQCALSR